MTYGTSVHYLSKKFSNLEIAAESFGGAFSGELVLVHFGYLNFPCDTWY